MSEGGAPDLPRLARTGMLLGGHVLLGEFRQSGKGAESGADVDMRFWTLMRYSGERVVRLPVFVDPDEARRAAVAESL